MFRRFTARARGIVVAAEEEAEELGHEYIGTEHILLGLLVRAEGSTASVLASLGLSAADTRRETEEIIGAGSSWLDPDALASIGIDLAEVRMRIDEAFGPDAFEAARRRRCRGLVGRRRFTPRAKAVLASALREARALGHPHIGDEHILLGLLRQTGGISAQIMRRRGISADRARQGLLAALVAEGGGNSRAA